MKGYDEGDLQTEMIGQSIDRPRSKVGMDEIETTYLQSVPECGAQRCELVQYRFGSSEGPTAIGKRMNLTVGKPSPVETSMTEDLGVVTPVV